MTTPRPFSSPFYGWKLLIVLSAVVGVNLGFCYVGASVTNAAMAASLGLSRAALGMGFTMFMLVVGLCAPLSARAVKRFGARDTIIAGSVLVAAGALLLATVVSQGWHYVLAYGVVLAIGTAFGSVVPAQSCVSQWFTKRRGFALALVLTGSGLAGTVAAPLLNGAIAYSGGNWRAGWLCLLAFALIVGVLALLFVKNTPADVGQHAEGHRADDIAPGTSAGGAAAPAAVRDWTLREAIRSRPFWLIALAACGETVPGGTLIAHGVPHLKDLGHSATAAASAMSAYALCSIFGKLAAGWLCDRYEARHAWSGFILLAAFSAMAAIFATSLPMMYLFTALLGLGAGGALSGWHANIARYFGPSAFAGILGAQMPFTNAVAAVSPLLVGLAYDRLGTYAPAFYAITVLGLLVTVMLIGAWPKGHVSTVPAKTAPA